MSRATDRPGHSQAGAIERDFVAAWWLLAEAGGAELHDEPGLRRGMQVATLQASNMGRPVYERLGFEFVCDFIPYRAE